METAACFHLVAEALPEQLARVYCRTAESPYHRTAEPPKAKVHSVNDVPQNKLSVTAGEIIQHAKGRKPKDHNI
jgi:hypothetical protein